MDATQLETIMSWFHKGIAVNIMDGYLQLWDCRTNRHVAYLYQDGTITTDRDERGEGVHIEGKLPR